MCSEVVIALQGVAKRYRLFNRPQDRLFTLLPGLSRFAHERSFHGLHPLALEVRQGEVVGIVGRNGAGKSTLLQLICQTLPPSEGRLRVSGRVSALLELGAGFNPEFSGRENVFLSGAILGMTRRQLEARLPEILAFADIGAFVDQPVKTYSSGMFVRLAFAVATAVDPDILVVDEALSVGDGAFARKSFERIMGMKTAGKTILFCSHSLYQVEAICSRALWLEGGRLIEDGAPDEVIAHYQRFLDTGLMPGELSRADEAVPRPPTPTPTAESTEQPIAVEATPQAAAPAPAEAHHPSGFARLSRCEVRIDGQADEPLQAHSGESTLEILVSFESDPALPCPTVAVTLSTADGHIVTSAATWEDGVAIARDARGRGRARICFPALPLLKGRYGVGAYVFCEQGVHSYGWVDPVVTFSVSQRGIEKGYCRLPHQWQCQPEPGL